LQGITEEVGGDEGDLIKKTSNPLLQLYKGLDKVTCPI